MTSRQLQFTPTNNRITVSIPIIDDTVIEEVERFFANLQVDSTLFPAVTLVNDRANVDIVSDDGMYTSTIRISRSTCNWIVV